jgi:hypothetical protein
MRGFWGWRDKRPAVGLGSCGWFWGVLTDGIAPVATALGAISALFSKHLALATVISGGNPAS